MVVRLNKGKFLGGFEDFADLVLVRIRGLIRDWRGNGFSLALIAFPFPLPHFAFIRQPLFHMEPV